MVVVAVVVVVVQTLLCDMWCGQHAHACPYAHTLAAPIEMDQCHCTGPFGWTDQPAKALRLSLRKQATGVPRCKTLHPTPIRGEDCEARRPHPPTPSEEGGRNLFHRLEVECRGSGMLTGLTLPCVFFLVRRTLLAMLSSPPAK